MKKLLLLLFLVLSMVLPVNAAFKPETKVNSIGKNILVKNKLPNNIIFKISETDMDSQTVDYNQQVYIPKTDLAYAGNENEVAAVIAQEIGVIMNAHVSKQAMVGNISSAIAGGIQNEKLQNSALIINQLSLSNMSKKDQMEADVTGVDLMIQAGYNPLAMIVLLNKQPGTYVEALKGTPSNYDRAIYIYNYLSYNYPSKVKSGYNCQEYKTFLTYITPVIKERNSNKKKLAKFKAEQAKLKKARIKQLAKYRATGGLNGWDASLTVLKVLSESSEQK